MEMRTLAGFHRNYRNATQARSAPADPLPTFTSVAIVTLAIGIGANSAIFSVIEGVLLKPLPFPHAEQLIALDHTAPGVNLPNAGAAPFLYCLTAIAPAIAFWPILMDDFSGDQPFVSRTLAYMIRSRRTASSGFLTEVSQAVWSVNPNLPLANVRTLQQIYDKSLARTSFALVMLAIAGAMALLLGVAGIYRVISYSVSQRTREIGIRVALGAQRGEVTRMFVRHGARLATIGIACGLAAAFALTRLMSSLLFDVNPIDPLTFGGVALGLAMAAVVASYVPALHATTVDPVEALRAE